MQSAEFRLGEPVTVSRALVRTYEERVVPVSWGTAKQQWRVWVPKPLDRVLFDRTTVSGIVIGTRTLMDVRREYLGYDEGWDNDLSSAVRFQAVWVAFDLRRKPLFVLPEDVHRAEG